MYRCAFMHRVASAFLRPCSRYGSGSGNVVNYSALVRTHTVAEPSRLTFCEWRYWRQALFYATGARKESVQHMSDGRNTQLTKCLQYGNPENVSEVFERYCTLLDSRSFQPEHVLDFTTALRSAVYSNLRQLPWLHYDNHVIAYMQILMNNRIEELLRNPLYNQDHYEKIFSHIEDLIDGIPSEDCPSVLLSLLYSGMDKTETLVHKLLARCHDSVAVLDTTQLRDLTHVLQTLGGRDFALAGRIVSRLDELLRRDVKDVRIEATDLCISSPILGTYMSQNLQERTARGILRKVQQSSSSLDIPTIGCCFRYARKMRFRVRSDTLAQIKCVGKSMLNQLSDCSHLKSYHIAEICHNARNLTCFSRDVEEKIQAHSLQLLRENGGDLRVRDVTNLLFAFSKTAPPSVKEEVSQLLIDHLDDADVLTLSNIADNILDLGLDDLELISAFQSKVMENIDNISQYITRLVKILRLLRERQDTTSETRRFTRQLSAVLLKSLDRHHGYDPTLGVVVAQYVLPSVQTIIPATLMESLRFSIPRCNLSLMLMVLSSLDKIGNPRSRSLYNQILELRSCVQQNIGRQIHSATHASQLASLVKGLHIRSKMKDFALLDDIMDHYTTLTPSMSRSDYLHTLFVFRRFHRPYYHPHVFEDLITFTKNNYSQLNFTNVLDLVTVLANAGYRPENFEEFSAFTTQVLEEVMGTDDYPCQIHLAHCLSLMSVFPDRVLGHIFTFDYLEKVDSCIEESEESKDLLRNAMMQLNRSVILECPHLDVPWFHQQYCQSQVQRFGAKDFQKNSVMGEEVEGALQEVMSGQDCVTTCVYSPYFHPIDFEIVLDASGQPVSTETVKSLQPEEPGYQRVALMLVGNHRLCTSSSQRRGTYLRDRRHLEILGYRVEEISRPDWHSMAVRDWGARVDLVRSKIFHDLNDKQFQGSAAEKSSQLS